MESPLDTSDYLALFKGEAEEYLVTLSKGLLSLEKNPVQPSVVDDLFRAAHTLKGALRMMGYIEIQDTAHRLEDVFGRMKKGEVTATSAIVEQALKTLDVMTAQLEAVWRGASAAAADSPLSASASAEDYIRIPAGRIDTLLNLVGELLIYKAET